MKGCAVRPGVGWSISRHRKVTTWARLQSRVGPNWVALMPEVMPVSTAHRTAFSYQLPFCTSVKTLLLIFGSGHPAARQRKVTTWARLQICVGPNSVALMPEVMPSPTAQRTGV